VECYRYRLRELQKPRVTRPVVVYVVPPVVDCYQRESANLFRSLDDTEYGFDLVNSEYLVQELLQLAESQ